MGQVETEKYAMFCWTRAPEPCWCWYEGGNALHFLLYAVPREADLEYGVWLVRCTSYGQELESWETMNVVAAREQSEMPYKTESAVNEAKSFGKERANLEEKAINGTV